MIEFGSIITCFISPKTDMLFIGKGETERAAFADALTQCPPETWQAILKEYQEYLNMKEGKNEYQEAN